MVNGVIAEHSGVVGRLESLLAAFPDGVVEVTELRPLSDADLLQANELHARLSRLVGSAGAAIAGELAFRSRPELGPAGLARKSGHRTIDTLLKLTTGATKEQVMTTVAAGTLLVEAANEGRVDEVTGDVFTLTQPWLKPVGVAVAAGSVSVSAARSIGSGLGSPTSAVTATELESAALALVAQAVAGVDADHLFRNARDLRADLDIAGVRLREEESRRHRSLKHFPTPTGGRAIWDMDPETYATFTTVYDRLTSPQLGGVRFINPDMQEQADTIAADDRTPAQLASDGFIHLITAGADTDDSVMLGSGAPIIRLTVAETALDTGVGLARLDGQPQPLSIETAKRFLCSGETLRIRLDPYGTPIEVEAEQRLFTRKQREALATTFGGCMDPTCDRPPSWCEAHHIQHWKRDHGKTVLANAILLCKYHHLKYHNDGYEIIRNTDGHYWQIPPTTADPTQTPIPMPHKTRNLHDLTTATIRTTIRTPTPHTEKPTPKR